MDGLHSAEQALRFLEQRFPDRLPTQPTTESGLAKLQGHQEVIRLLRNALQDDED